MTAGPTRIRCKHNAPLEDRLALHSRRDESTGCWVWTSSVSTKGYGLIKLRGKRRKVHRVAYEHFVGPIPEGLQIDHLCRNPPCFEPTHLEPVTGIENVLRGVRARTHCREGHAYAEHGLARNGRRVCQVCRARRRKEHRKAAA